MNFEGLFVIIKRSGLTLVYSPLQVTWNTPNRALVRLSAIKITHIYSMLTAFERLPNTSRIWIFPADRALSPSESKELLDSVDSYLTGWKAHGAPVQAARDLRYNQFLIIAADPEITAPSGCSIDDLTRNIKALSEKIGADFFGAMKIFYREGEQIKAVDRSTFKSLGKAGQVDGETIVFNNGLTTLKELWDGKWELPAGESWHRQLVGITGFEPVTSRV